MFVTEEPFACVYFINHPMNESLLQRDYGHAGECSMRLLNYTPAWNVP